MSDTPRTDAHNWHDGDYDDPLHAFYDFARQLERELNAAQQRIKRLEEAGDLLARMVCRQDGYGIYQDEEDAVNGWNKAKDDKP